MPQPNPPQPATPVDPDLIPDVTGKAPNKKIKDKYEPLRRVKMQLNSASLSHANELKQVQQQCTHPNAALTNHFNSDTRKREDCMHCPDCDHCAWQLARATPNV